MNAEEHVTSTPDQEVLRSMLEEIEHYRKGRTHFPGLVGALGAGLGSLTPASSGLAEVLREKWRILEEVNAVALDEGSLHPRERDQPLAEATLRDTMDVLADAVRSSAAP